MKRRLVFVLGLIGLTLIFSALVQARTVRIGVVYDGDSQGFPAARDLFFNEIESMTRGAHTVVFPAETQISGNWNVPQINRAIDRLMASGQVDMLLTLGQVSTHEVCRRRRLSKPVFAAYVVDAKLQGIPSKKGTSGIRNLNYINNLSDHNRALQLFRRIAPFYRMTILADDFLLASIPQLNTVARRLANEFSIKVTVAKVGDSGAGALERIPADTDAVFLSLLPRLSDPEFQKLVDGLTARKLPSFSFRGRTDVKKGILAGTIPEDSLLHLARSVAINVQEVLDGADAGDLSTTFAAGEELAINMATARAIHVYPGWDLLTEADLLNDEPIGIGRRLNIHMAMQEALAANLDLAAANRSVEAGMARVQEARSPLLPQVGVNTQASVIDDDRARASFGIQPERLWTGSLQASQLIYSDKAWAGFTIEQYRQTSREQGRDAVRLDILQAAAGAYLNVLRARSIERIQKENLKLTRENLERARIRVEIGAGGPEEVYRWESQIADSRRNVLTAQSITLDAISAMNNVLNRPLREMFAPVEADYTEPMGILPDRRLMAYMDNPMELGILRDFLVTEGLDASPELQQVDAAIAAQERGITLAKREFWVPTVSLFGDVTETLSKGGEGSGSSSIGTLNLPEKDDTDWTAGVQATLPLFAGGGRSATLKRSREELARLRYDRDNTANRIEVRILNAVHLIRASYPGIRLSTDAADAARRNLILVTDAYVRGIKSIIDLIDAQNQALVADQQAANAVYDFLIDLMAVQRSTGSFFLFAPEEERDAWMERLNRYAMDAQQRARQG
ncbi:TolC family protein [Desulfosarcina sp.]|uniref:TolC family protein n=1 Tax=Desulfosarcina sp. TaxID=2027861 RepID=UPI0035692720